MDSTKVILLTLAFSLFTSCQFDNSRYEVFPKTESNLKFTKLAESWDEAIPLGNGILGALIWEKNNRLRISLDRADLWDLRPMENLDRPEWLFSWVKEQWEQNNYSAVQKMFDVPYDQNPAPSKIPGGALEFDISAIGPVESVQLDIKNAICEINWENGTSLQVYISAENPVGWFRFNGLDNSILPELIPPEYTRKDDSGDESPVTGQDLTRLGYPSGEIIKNESSINYDQKGWGGFKYQISIRWKEHKNTMDGCWSISSEFPGWAEQTKAEHYTVEAIKKGFSEQFTEHKKWWSDFWSKSSISIPDPVLNKQWYLEMYKLGASTGNGAPPISLQAIWTADNGKLPPWKGDFHHDLNTQLSYWPSYSSNHLSQANGFIDWLFKNKREFEQYTSDYFQVNGLNVPGVTTLTGKPMGGWIQYSFGPTVSAWLGQHFYLHWRYSMDREFLEKKAYPWIKEVAIYLEELSVIDNNGKRRLPLSSSPEIFDNSPQAWFEDITNFDLGMTRWTFEKAAELANELGKSEEAAKWEIISTEWPMYDIDPESGFSFVKGIPYDESHRHFSHLVAFHPLGLVDWSKGDKDRHIIKSTIENLDRIGPDWWCGYSYSWLGNLKARAFDGDGAAEALKIFANDFCLPNSFHVNGDQSGTGKSKYTYRPFTLEGNFAFASGIQEMLIQSHTGIVRLFPAIPVDWEEVSFKNLRTERAFLFSASMSNKEVTEVNIFSEKGGILKISNPFNNEDFKCSASYKIIDNILEIETRPGQNFRIKI